jgi:hypothetical protein
MSSINLLEARTALPLLRKTILRFEMGLIEAYARALEEELKAILEIQQEEVIDSGPRT